MAKVNSKSLYLDIRIPLITIRVVLISTVLSFISFGLLFPISFFAFNYLYNQLISIPTIHLPLSNYVLNYDFDNVPPFVIISSALDPLYANQPHRKDWNREVFGEFAYDLNYDFNFEFDAYCQHNYNSNYEPIMYKVSIVSNHLIDQLSPYGVKPYIHKRFHLWPISNNIHQLENPQVLVSSMNTVVLNCDGERSEQYSEKLKLRDLIPPLISTWFVPPIVNNFQPVSVKTHESMYNIPLLKEVRFESYLTSNNRHFFENNEFSILLEFNKPNIVINPLNSEIVINTSWRGLRYYLFHYRFLSYILGVLALWTSSSVMLVLTVGLIGWIDAASEVQTSDIDDDSDDESIKGEPQDTTTFIKQEYSEHEIPAQQA